MSNRTHNIFFHLHTVSGIVISVGLFIIFFAGAFTLFVEPIEHWEEGTAHNTGNSHYSNAVDYNRLMDSLSAGNYDLYGRTMYVTEQQGVKNISIYLSGTEDSLASDSAKKSLRLQFNTNDYTVTNAGEGNYSLGDLLYNLHFFYQLGDFGYYLSGVVSLFFLFAIVTGIIVHWKKIVMNFFVFRPRQKLKTVWTDAHTALGVIGIPFQFMYALTGAMFGLGILVALSGSLMYGGSKQKYYDALYNDHEEIRLGKPAVISGFDYNLYRQKAETRWQGFTPRYISVAHLASTTQQFSVYGYTDIKDRFLNDGEVVFDMTTGRVIHEHDPFHKEYEDYVWSPVYRLHFANFYSLNTFSKYALKMIYFVMALITCFVIISGVLIWLEARKKTNISDRQRKFNEGVGHIYLAFCLSMFPVTAFSMIIAKLLPEHLGEQRKIIINSVFFGGWLLLSIFFWLRKNNYFTNKYALLSTGILGLCIPLVSGFYSGDWLWYSYANYYYDVFLIDSLWILLAVASLFALKRMKKSSHIQ